MSTQEKPIVRDKKSAMRLWNYLERLAGFRTSHSRRKLEFDSIDLPILAIDTNLLEVIFDTDNHQICFFSDDEPYEREFVKYCFFKHIFEEFTENSPLIVLPGHDRESASFFESFSDGLAKAEELYKSASKDISNLKLILNNRTSNKFAAEFRQAYQKIALRNLRVKLLRLFLDNIHAGKVVALGSSGLTKNSSQVLSSLNSFPRNLVEVKHERKIKNEIEDFLESEIFDHMPRDYQKRLKTYKSDALALSRIITINNGLSDYGQRVFLLTLDKFLQQCWMLFSKDRNERNSFEISDSRSVLSPSSFFESINFFGASATSDQHSKRAPIVSLSDTINILLGPVLGEHRLSETHQNNLSSNLEDYPAFREHFSEVFKISPNLPVKLRTMFSSAIESQDASALVRFGLNAKHDDINDADWEVIVNGLEVWLGEQEDITYQEFAFSAMTFGILFTNRMKDRTNVFRYMPPIYFDRFPEATRAVEKILNTGSNGLDLEKIRDEIEVLKVEDPTLYTTYLTWALAFGSLGLYKNALMGAQKAALLVPSPAQNVQVISGREAYFLCGYFTRILAESIASSNAAILDYIPKVSQSLARDGKNYYAEGVDFGEQSLPYIALEQRTQTERFSAETQLHVWQSFKGTKIGSVDSGNVLSLLGKILKFTSEIIQLQVQVIAGEADMKSSLLNVLKYCHYENGTNIVTLTNIIRSLADKSVVENLNNWSQLDDFLLDFLENIDSFPSMSPNSSSALHMMTKISLHRIYGSPQNNETQVDEYLGKLKNIFRESSSYSLLSKYEYHRIKHFLK